MLAVGSQVIGAALRKTFKQLNISECPSNLYLSPIICIVFSQIFIIVFIEFALVYFLLCDQRFTLAILHPIKLNVMHVLCKLASGKQALYALPIRISNEFLICQQFYCPVLLKGIRRDLMKICRIENCVITHNPSPVFNRLFPISPDDFPSKLIFYVSDSVLDISR